MTDQQLQQPQPQPQPQPQQAQPLTPPPMQQPQPPAYITFDTTPPKTVQISPLGTMQQVQTQPPQPQTPPPANPYQSIIAEQKAQIEALMQQNSTLSGQITQMVQNGYQAVQQQPQQVQQVPQVGQNWAQQPQYAPVYMPEQGPLSLSQDVSLEGLASEIGKAPDNGQG